MELLDINKNIAYCDDACGVRSGEPIWTGRGLSAVIDLYGCTADAADFEFDSMQWWWVWFRHHTASKQGGAETG